MKRKIKKRNGKYELFNPDKLEKSILACLNISYPHGKNQEVAHKIMRTISNLLSDDQLNTTQDIGNQIQIELLNYKKHKAAKEYLLYAQQKALDNLQKLELLNKKSLSQTEKKFSLYSIKILASRYLLRNQNNTIIEDVEQLFKRVAVTIGLADILYNRTVFKHNEGDKTLSQEAIKYYKQSIKNTKLLKPQSIDDLLTRYTVGKYRLNIYHIETLARTYALLAQEGHIIVSFPKLLQMIENDYFAHISKYITKYYKLMVEQNFIPNSPTLMNAGYRLGQLSACFVTEIKDSLKSIMQATTETALIAQSGGGIGINYSQLRPKGDIVASTAGIASGPISFMHIIDTVTEVVKQGGKRRGANMGILEVWHPDIMEFITLKQNPNKLNNFNLSVGIWDDFWKALEKDTSISLVNPRTNEIQQSISVEHVIELIAHSVWKSAEPGVIFFDNINKHNPLKEYKGNIKCTNPCGEQPLYPYESCNLGSINLSNFVQNGKFNFTSFRKVVAIATRFLDNVIDLNKYPLSKIAHATRQTRKIGLGIMGLAHALYKLQIPYTSNEGYSLMNKLAETLTYESMAYSIKLARERGMFPLFNQSSYKNGTIPLSGYYELSKHNYNWNNIRDNILKYGIRNIATTTIAPTGSISMIADTSSGIEPVFSLVYKKKITSGEYLYIDKIFKSVVKGIKIDFDEVMKQASDNYGRITGLEILPTDLPKIFLTSMDIHWADHIVAQAIWQKWIHSSISKTINMPFNATPSDVKQAYILAHKLGLKGITIYRDGSRETQVLYVEGKRKKIEAIPSTTAIQYMTKHKIQWQQKSPLNNPKLQFPNEHKVEKCPNCNGQLVHESGCIKCIECGWSACSVG